VLLRPDSLPWVAREIWGKFSVIGVDLELHEKGDGMNFANAWNESLETRESVRDGSVLEEEVGSGITPSGTGGLELRS
jgi:hypothetical protein